MRSSQEFKERLANTLECFFSTLFSCLGSGLREGGRQERERIFAGCDYTESEGPKLDMEGTNNKSRKDNNKILKNERKFNELKGDACEGLLDWED